MMLRLERIPSESFRPGSTTKGASVSGRVQMRPPPEVGTGGFGQSAARSSSIRETMFVQGSSSETVLKPIRLR